MDDRRVVMVICLVLVFGYCRDLGQHTSQGNTRHKMLTTNLDDAFVLERCLVKVAFFFGHLAQKETGVKMAGFVQQGLMQVRAGAGP